MWVTLKCIGFDCKEKYFNIQVDVKQNWGIGKKILDTIYLSVINNKIVYLPLLWFSLRFYISLEETKVFCCFTFLFICIYLSLEKEGKQ